jgi:NADPH2:quinone reductase
MKTVYIKEFGGVEALEIRDIPEPPSPREDELRVRVTHAGLNRADILQRRGAYPPPAGFDPKRPGLEFAGIVEDVGRNVTGFAAGDHVCGITSGEAQSELINIHAGLAVKTVLRGPEAAAVPEVFATAHDSLITQAELKTDEVVLIHAAASGVGLAAAQIAKAARCKVIGTTRSADKAAYISTSGKSSILFDHVIVTDNGPKFADRVLEVSDKHGADVIIDLVGGDYFPEDLHAAATKGRIVLIGLTAGRKAEFDMGIALSKRLRVIGTVLRSRSLDEKILVMDRFRNEIEPGFSDGRLAPEIDRVFPVEDVAAAHRFLESNQNVGKVILEFG